MTLPSPRHPSTETNGRVTGSRAVPVAAVLLVGVVCSLLLARMSSYSLLGYDTYPLIVTSRVQSWGDLLGTFTERLMDGRYPGAFHRPLISLTFALDHAVWGLAPLGYLLTNVLLFAGCGFALFALMGRLTATRPSLAAFVALSTFLLHPTHFEVLPVPARRPELLCCVFMLLSLWLQLSPRALQSKRLIWWPATATLLAIAAKETGFVLPLLIFVAVLLYVDGRTLAARTRRALRAVVPHACAVVAMLLVRLLVLGGVGGHKPFEAVEVLNGVRFFVRTIFRGLVFPQPVMRASALAWVLAGGLVAALTALAIVRAGAGRGSSRWVSGLVVALSWIVSVGVIYSAAGLVGPWYYLIPAAGWAMFVGTLAAGLADITVRGAPISRSLAMTALLLLGLLMLWQARFSPLIQRYDEWSRASDVSRAFFSETRQRIRLTPDGGTVLAPPLPTWVPPRPDRPTLFGAAVLADYSVQAWAELTFPDRIVEVRRQAGPSASDRVVVVINRRLAGY